MMKIKEVHIWSNGNVSTFTDDKKHFKGFILNPEVIDILNKCCDENTKFSFGIVGSFENMIDMPLGWWFKKMPSFLKYEEIKEANHEQVF